MIPPDHRIRQAFLHLEFSIKLFLYFEKGLVAQDEFDCDTTIQTREGEVRFGRGAFYTSRDLVLAAQNVYSSALGVCAIAMESALADFGSERNPADDSPKGQLRALVYQMRNAFAHDAMLPCWRVRGPHRRVLDLRAFGVPSLVDLEQLDGQALDLEQFGGMKGLERVRDAVLRWVRTGDPLAPEA